MLGARLGDRYGHRRTILVSLAVFLLGATAAAMAPSAIWLAVGRCLQGSAAAASVPCALRLLTTVAKHEGTRRRAIAAWSAAGAAAGAGGFVIGGIATDLTSWRYVFWAYLPLVTLLGVLIAAMIEPDRKGERIRSLNLPGSMTFTAAVVAFVVGSTLVTRPAGRAVGISLLAACGVLALAFSILDRRAEAPLLPGQLISAFQVRQGALAAFLNTATTGSVVTLLTLYLQNTLHRTPLEAAASLLPFSLAVIAGSSLSATLQRNLRPQWLVAMGLGLIAAAGVALIPWAEKSLAVPLCMTFAGVGIGLSSVAATRLGTSVEERWRGRDAGKAADTGLPHGADQVLRPPLQ